MSFLNDRQRAGLGAVRESKLVRPPENDDKETKILM